VTDREILASQEGLVPLGVMEWVSEWVRHIYSSEHFFSVCEVSASPCIVIYIWHWRLFLWPYATVWLLVTEFAKNRGITEFSEMDECLVLVFFFSSLGSKTVKVKICFFVTLRNSCLRDEKQNTVFVCVHVSACLLVTKSFDQNCWNP
jgi:hypothetical protein